MGTPEACNERMVPKASFDPFMLIGAGVPFIGGLTSSASALLPNNGPAPQSMSAAEAASKKRRHFAVTGVFAILPQSK